MGNANGSRTRAEGKGTASCGVLDSKGRMCELELKQAFWVPTYTRNLISVKKLASQGAIVSFGKEANIRTQDGTLLPLAVPVMTLTLFMFFLLCVTLDPERSQLNVSQALHMEVGDRRVGHPGWAAMQPKAERWCSGTGLSASTTSMMWNG